MDLGYREFGAKEFQISTNGLVAFVFLTKPLACIIRAPKARLRV